MRLILGIVDLLLLLYFILLIARLVLEWVQMLSREWTPRGVVLVLAELVYSATDPPIRAVRRVVRPVRIGPVQLDLAFLIVFLVIIVLRAVVQSIAARL